MKKRLLWLLTPIQKFLQRIGRQESKITKEQVEGIKCLAKPGDILLSFEYGRPTSIFIKGFFDHATILTNQGTIMEAVGDKFLNNVNIGGVREVDFEEWLYKKDYVAVIRPFYSNGDFINRLAAKESLAYKGRGYDYTFEIGSEKLYCSELPYICYKSHDPLFMSWIDNNQEILPQMYYDLTEDLPRSGITFKLIYDTRYE